MSAIGSLTPSTASGLLTREVSRPTLIDDGARGTAGTTSAQPSNDPARGAAGSAAREAAEQFVAQTLVLPILASLRSSSDAAEPFKPSEAEKQFGALLDARVAEDITRAAKFPLVDRIAGDLRRAQVTEGSAA